MTADIHYLTAEAEAQMKRAAESMPDDTAAQAAIRDVCRAFDALKSVPPEALARELLLDNQQRPANVERFLDNLRAELTWVKLRVHAERMKIIRGQK